MSTCLLSIDLWVKGSQTWNLVTNFGQLARNQCPCGVWLPWELQSGAVGYGCSLGLTHIWAEEVISLGSINLLPRLLTWMKVSSSGLVGLEEGIWGICLFSGWGFFCLEEIPCWFPTDTASFTFDLNGKEKSIWGKSVCTGYRCLSEVHIDSFSFVKC